ncbi:hypothetical protein ACJMK2_023342 [Sinanodonta woodiana]|uniref:ABC transporter domain-containing protein n=1 Tax=Sinanodonta woodiana TaxID=1069815 RepID=A0ABD3T3X2_SINWO
MDDRKPFLRTSKTNESTFVRFNFSFDATTSFDERWGRAHSEDPGRKRDDRATYRRFKSVDDDLDNISRSSYETVSTRVNIESQSSIDSNGVKNGDGMSSSPPDVMSTKDANGSTIKFESLQNEEYENNLDVRERLYRNKSPSVIESHNVTLTWRDVNVFVKPPSRRCFRGPDPAIKPKQVLHNVNGLVKYGTLLAVLGASGSGKTTLLNSLTLRNQKTLDVTGDIRVNGVNVGRGIRNISAYVQQDDIFIATMTVREHLIFRAMLRMEKTITTQARLARVEEVIRELGLTKCIDNVIGWPGRTKGISGGEMRRLSFASEVLTNPPLLFCDEPTSGLDSFMAENIVQTLQGMAKGGRTIICTIHQPSSEIYALFDQVLLMAEGRVAFLGSSQNALNFFQQHGYVCPVNYNPADYFIMTLAVAPERRAECNDRIHRICDAFQETREAKEMEEETNVLRSCVKKASPVFNEAFSETSRYEASWCKQFVCVFKRCWLTSIREPNIIRVRFLQTMVIGTIVGLIFFNLTVDQPGVQNINGIMFILITEMTASSMFSAVTTFPLELPIFLREYGIGLYRTDVYFLSKSLSELPSFIIIPSLFIAIVYWMSGLYGTAKAFFICYGILILVVNTTVSFGLVVSCMSYSIDMALALAPPLMIPLFLLGGLLINVDSIPVYLSWLQYFSWFKYAFELIALNQWENIDNIGGCEVPNSSECVFPNGHVVMEYFGLQESNWNLDIYLMVTLMIGYRIIAFIILFIRARRSAA